MRTTKTTRVVFASRALSGAGVNGQPRLNKCKAWRIVARQALDFAAAQPAVAAGMLPPAPAGCFDGVYPVWVRPADLDGQPFTSQGLLLVDNSGWQHHPMGDNWSIEHVGQVGTAADLFAYVVETVQDDDEAGQLLVSPQRTVTAIYDPGALANPAVQDSGPLEVSSFDTVEVLFLAVGAAALSAVVKKLADDGATIAQGGVAPGAGVTGWNLMGGAQMPQGSGTNSYLGAVPRRIQTVAQGGVAGTIRTLVLGIRSAR